MMTDQQPMRVRSLINGCWDQEGTTEPIHYPYDGRVVAELCATPLKRVHDAVDTAYDAWMSWRHVPAHERARILSRVAQLMAEQAETLANVMTLQAGKTLRESRTEVTRSQATMQLSAEEAKRIVGEVIPMDAVAPGTGKLGFTLRVPVGVVAGISPFNAPLSTVCHKVGPALAAGNALVLKPHPHGAGVAALLAELCLEAGVPAGVFSVVHGGADVGHALTTHPRVALVNFTGSGQVADRIIREVGLKRVLLELGGNAPTIVHHDAEMRKAVPQCADAAFGLTGQSCISTQRIYAHRAIYEPFVEALVTAAQSKRVGDPMDSATDIGPMIDQAAAERVEKWIREAEQAGAIVRCGGRRDGTLVWPTVLTDVHPTMKVVCEEVFGPVVTVTPYDAIDEAIHAANDSPWGLKSGIFTASLNVMLKAARELEYGTVNVNAASRARVDHEPSGGVKLSGWGKEGPRYAIEEMTYLKMVSIVPAE